MKQDKWCIGILGSGKMGSDIFEYLLQFDLQLTWLTRSEQSKQKKILETEKKLSRFVRWGALTQGEYESKRRHIDITNDINHLKNADFIIECISEELEAKKNLLRSVEMIIDQKAIILTNTSSLPLSEIFGLMKCKNRCAGLHFFYPVQLKNIVEINKIPENDNLTINAIYEFVDFVGRKRILLEKPYHFVLNRLFFPYLAQAFKLLDTGKFNAAEIDRAIEDQLFPIGPFRFVESVGIEIIAVSIKNYAITEDEKIFCSSIQLHLGSLIKKRTPGANESTVVYESEFENKNDKNSLAIEDTLHAYLSLVSVFVNTLFCELDRGYISAEELYDSIAEYMGIEKPIKTFIESVCTSEIVNELNRLYSLTEEKMYIPASSLVTRAMRTAGRSGDEV